MWDLIQQLLRRLLGLEPRQPEQSNSVVVNVNATPVQRHDYARVESMDRQHPASSTVANLSPPLADQAADPGEMERRLREVPVVASRLNHARDRNAAEAAILYFCRGVDNPAERESRTKTWRIVEQAFAGLRREMPT